MIVLVEKIELIHYVFASHLNFYDGDQLEVIAHFEGFCGKFYYNAIDATT